jgi:DNA-binding NarL/FixJ family response regulator
VSFQMQPVTVAIADVDHGRRATYEHILQDEPGITLLANVASSHESSKVLRLVDRRIKPRVNVSPSENEVARIKRLKPMVLLVNLDMCADEDYALLLSLRCECPETIVVLLADDSVQEGKIMQALKIGARGYLKSKTAQSHLSKAIQVVSRGEAWVSRKMVGNIMEHVLNS